MNKFWYKVCLVALAFGLCFGLARPASVKAQSLTVQAHVQDYGWLPRVGEGQPSGTTGESRRMEAVIVWCDSVEYQVHLAGIGWTNYVSSGNIAGTVGESRRKEAIRIRLTGSMAQRYDVFYRTHLEGIGWTNWVSNNADSGTTGQSRRMEALQVKLVAKGN